MNAVPLVAPAGQKGRTEIPGAVADLPAWPGMQTLEQAFDYWVDAWQRSVLFLDVLRQRGNNHFEHSAQQAPNVLTLPVRAGHARRPHADAAGQLRPGADPAAGRCHRRSAQAPLHRLRSARRPRAGHRRHEAGQRDRRRARRRPSLLFRGLPARADAGPDDRGCLPRRGGLHREGRRAAIPRPRASPA